MLHVVGGYIFVAQVGGDVGNNGREDTRSDHTNEDGVDSFVLRVGNNIAVTAGGHDREAPVDAADKISA